MKHVRKSLSKKLSIGSKVNYFLRNIVIIYSLCIVVVKKNITPMNKKSNISLHIPLWIFTVIFFTILFVNYFTEIPKGLQITLTAIAIIIFGFFIVRYLENGLLFQLALVCLALLILIESVNIAESTIS